MLELDGNYLEGGGALVRVALALSALTGKEFKVNSIRSGRPEPGLKAQHLTAITALKAVCSAETNEINIGSTELYFKPEKIKKGIYELDIGTAGSITLLLQALILPSLFAPGKITFNIKGGTSGKWQASVDYLQNILLPHLYRFAEKIELKILKRGYYPKGGGLVKLEITPRFKLKNYSTFDLFCEDLQHKTAKMKLVEQGKLEQIRGDVNISSQLKEKEIAERIKISAESCLKEYNVPKNIRIEYADSPSPGGEILLYGIFSSKGKIEYDNPIILGGDALAEAGKSSEMVGKEAAEELKEQIKSGAAVDHHLADQLIMFMGLLPGSEIKASEITKHTQTNIYVVEKFLPVKFETEENIIKVKQNN